MPSQILSLSALLLLADANFKKLTYNGDSTVLISLANNAMTRGKVILRVIAVLIRDSKKCYPRCIRVSLNANLGS